MHWSVLENRKRDVGPGKHIEDLRDAKTSSDHKRKDAMVTGESDKGKYKTGDKTRKNDKKDTRKTKKLSLGRTGT